MEVPRHYLPLFEWPLDLVPTVSPSACTGSNMVHPRCVHADGLHACSVPCSPPPIATQTPLLISVHMYVYSDSVLFFLILMLCMVELLNVRIQTSTKGLPGNGLSNCATGNCLCKEAKWNAVYPSKSFACGLAPLSSKKLFKERRKKQTCGQLGSLTHSELDG